jgi:hypothetical protein
MPSVSVIFPTYNRAQLRHEFPIETAFDAYGSDQPPRHRKYSLRALISNLPSALHNRGHLLILVRASIDLLYSGPFEGFF